MITTITLNPAVDKTVEIGNFEVGTVNRVSTTRLDAGGKGINVSKVIRSLGGTSKAVGVLGGMTGRFIKNYLDAAGIENDFVFIEGDTRINLKIVDSIRKTNTDINEPGTKIAIGDMERLEQLVFRHLEAGSILVLSGSVPENVDKGIYAKWISLCKKADAKVILDADGELLKQGIKAGPFLVKPNIHEMERFFGKAVHSVEEAEQLARSWMQEYGIAMVAVSLGEKGALFLNKDHSVLAHGIPVEVKSTVGAGDAMVAALAFALHHGYGFEKSVRLAVASGTANVMTCGTESAAYGIIAGLESKVRLEYLAAGQR